jgi:hypothetical protein
VLGGGVEKYGSIFLNAISVVLLQNINKEQLIQNKGKYKTKLMRANI